MTLSNIFFRGTAFILQQYFYSIFEGGQYFYSIFEGGDES